MTLDYKRDWIEILRAEINGRGFTTSSTTDFEAVPIQYFNLRKRLIPTKKRQVKISKEFLCPTDKVKSIETLKNKILNGEDLTPYLSTRLTDLDYRDSMLNDWGIYHLHLGETFRPDGFIERSGPLLYARFDEDHFYFINIYEHNNWTKKVLIKILHDNWPDSIENFRIREIIGLTHNLNEDEIRQARKYGVTTMIEIDTSVVYAPLGGGFMTDGTSLEVRRSVNYMHKLLNIFEKTTRDNIDKVKEHIAKEQLPMPADFNFKLEIDNGALFAIEQSTRIALRLGDWNKL